MYGREQNTVDGKFPFQEKPPLIVWKEWRMALRPSFVRRSEENTHEHKLLFPLERGLPLIIDFKWMPKVHLR